MFCKVAAFGGKPREIPGDSYFVSQSDVLFKNNCDWRIGFPMEACGAGLPVAFGKRLPGGGGLVICAT
jgi:hypothetical protein